MRAAILATVVALGVGSSACATKKWVRTQVGEQVGEVNAKVETLNKTVEETQQRTQENEKRIGQVDAKAEQVGLWAKDARSAADAAKMSADAAGAKAEEIDKLSKRLLYEVVLSEDQGSFQFGKADLPDPAKARIDELINQVKADPRGAYVEIEGHTDNVGSKEVNERLGLQRAESVKRYLYENHQVPLHKMNVISYGEDKPVAPNTNRAGRAQNRRVVIKVLS